MTFDKLSIVLVGAGNMGGAMMGGWLKNGISASQINVIDPSPPPNIKTQIAETGVNWSKDSEDISAPDVLLIAVKPQIMAGVLAGITHLVGPQTMVISVAAGKKLEFLASYLGEGAMVRVMANTPALIQRGITIICANSKVSTAQKKQTTKLLQAIGAVEWIDDENLMDAVTAVSGSGPAYVFYLAEALEAAAIKAGLPDELAQTLAIETVAGSGELLRRSDLSPAVLRENVTSPNGTTQAALEVLMGKDGLVKLMGEAVHAAAARSRELS